MSRGPGTDAASRVVLEFQSVMDQFLDLERYVLGVYGSARREPSTAPVTAPPAALKPIPPATIEPTPVVTVEPTPAVTPHVVAVTQSAPNSIEQSVKALRLTPRPVTRPAPATRATLPRDGVIVLTDDERGVCASLAEKLQRAGHRVAIVSATQTEDQGRHIYHSALASEADVERTVSAISAACGPIAALVHLIPLAPGLAFDQLDVDWWWHRLSLETRGLFLLTRALRLSLETAAANGGACVVGVTAMGGAFGCDSAGDNREIFPGHGGVTGYIKCLATEWPKVRAKTVDLDPAESPGVLADRVFDELWIDDGEVEIGYAGGTRVGLDVVPLPSAIADGFAIASDSVILATGGARGITAEVCLELAERYQPTFVLVGQARLPDPVEAAETRDLTSPADLKRALTDRLRAEGSALTPARIEKAYQRLLKEREIRRNMSALVAAGSRVHYVALDVRDADALGAVIDDIYTAYGRIDGLIHGAGLIEDKLIKDKALDSFDRVFGTKTISTFVLSRLLRPESLRFAVFFTSVAGRFGNRGQADYAAANEVVNKLAAVLSARWPNRVCAMNWAPWDRTGMVSPELKREFAKRGVELLPPAEGRRAFWEEIQQHRSDAPEIVVAGGAGMRLSAPPATTATPVRAEPLPLLKHVTDRRAAGSTVQYFRTIDPAIDTYLTDHRLDGVPVLPLAVATELMAEAAQATWPDMIVTAVRDLRLFKGITVEAPVPTVIAVRAPVHSNDDGVIEADVEISTPSTKPPTRYRCIAELSPRLAQPPVFTASLDSLAPQSWSIEDTYRRWTFHGPAFQRLTSVDGIGSGGIVGRMTSSSYSSGVAGVARADWLFDPFIVDAALQLVLIWSRARNDMTALPSRFSVLRRYDRLSDHLLTTHVRIESRNDGHALMNEVAFVDAGGRPVAILEGLEATCTSALNRLAAGARDLASTG